MTIEKQNQYGSINITNELQCLQVVLLLNAMALLAWRLNNFFKDGWAELLKGENFTKGVVVNKTEAGLVLMSL